MHLARHSLCSPCERQNLSWSQREGRHRYNSAAEMGAAPWLSTRIYRHCIRPLHFEKNMSIPSCYRVSRHFQQSHPFVFLSLVLRFCKGPASVPLAQPEGRSRANSTSRLRLPRTPRPAFKDADIRSGARLPRPEQESGKSRRSRGSPVLPP